MPEQRHELGSHQPIAEWAFGWLMIWHQRAETTGGVLSITEVVLPRGDEPPVHLHSREDELCFVLDGELTVHRGLARIQAGPGTSVWLPRGIPHGFAVHTATARVLLTLAAQFGAALAPETRRSRDPHPAPRSGATSGSTH